MCACAACNHAKSDEQASVYVRLSTDNCVRGGAVGVPEALLSPTSPLALTLKTTGPVGGAPCLLAFLTLTYADLYICVVYGGRADAACLPLILLVVGAFCFQVFEAPFRSPLGPCSLPTSLTSPRSCVLTCTPMLVAAMACPTQAELGLHS